MTATKQKVFTIDAAGKTYGRLASDVAATLRGKKSVDFTPHIDPRVRVTVTNLLKLSFTGNKMTQKVYYHHSMHPGGLTATKLSEAWSKKPIQTFTKTVERMLQPNRTRKELMKRLSIQL